jgi:hypothetical protein
MNQGQRAGISAYLFKLEHCTLEHIYVRCPMDPPYSTGSPDAAQSLKPPL